MMDLIQGKCWLKRAGEIDLGHEMKGSPGGKTMLVHHGLTFVNLLGFSGGAVESKPTEHRTADPHRVAWRPARMTRIA